MKNFKLSAFVLALGLAVMSAFAFNPHKTMTTYHYNGTTQNIGDLSNPLKWAPGVACDPTGPKVCSIDFDGNQSAFNTYISSFSSQTPADVLAVATGRKD
jgi:hypothetical protein